MKVGWALSEAEDMLVIAVDLENRVSELMDSNVGDVKERDSALRDEVVWQASGLERG